MFVRIFIILSITLGYLEAQSAQYQMALLQQKVEQLSERVEGLTTIIEGLNASISQIKESKNEANNSEQVAMEQKMMKKKIEDLSKECITQSKLETLLSQYQKSDTKSKSAVTLSSEKKSNAQLYREGAQLFQKHQYDKAHERFALMVEKHYKPAASNYYLGEIAYYTKKYSDAIYYFKKSASLYDKASYIDTLLLHTAISLEKEGDKAQAKLFYQTIIDDYPNKKSAKIAKSNLKHNRNSHK